MVAAAALLLMVPDAAWAHPDAGAAHGFGHGFAHPLFGWDHLLAMVAVGLWAAQRGGRALWALPLAFVGAMAIGGAVGVANVAIPGVELGIVASVLVLGLVVALAARVPLGASVAMIGVFAVLHGVAHGAEMPAGVGGAAYGAGFIAATALLHAAGVAFVAGARSALGSGAPVWIRMSGATISALGLVLLAL
jgi:urease accessory protein